MARDQKRDNNLSRRKCTFEMMSLTPEDLAGIVDSKHRHSGDSRRPGALLEVTIGPGMGAAGLERG